MFKNILNTFFVRVFNAIITLAITIIISRSLGAEIKGQQGLILTTISLLHIIMCIVGSGSIVYLIPRYNFSKLLSASYIWMFLIAIIFVLVSPFISAIPKVFVYHIVILTLLVNLFNIHISALIAKEKIKKANLLIIIQVSVQISMLILYVFYYNNISVYSYIYSLYFTYGISYILSLFVSLKEFEFSIKGINFLSVFEGGKKLFRYGVYNQLDVFAQVLSFRLSYYILAAYENNAAVGKYSVAVSIAESIWLISRSISLVHYARVSNSDDMYRSTELTTMFIKISTILTLLAVLFILLIPSSLYTWVFGADFYQIKEILYYLVGGVVFFSTSFMISSLFSGSGKQHINSIASIIGFVVTIIGAYIFIPISGVYGAALTATISYFVTTAVKLLYFKKTTLFELSHLLLTKEDIKQAKVLIVSYLKK